MIAVIYGERKASILNRPEQIWFDSKTELGLVYVLGRIRKHIHEAALGWSEDARNKLQQV